MTCKIEEVSAARRRPYLAVRNGRTRRCVDIASLLLLTAVVPVAEGQGSAPAAPTNLYVPFVTRFEIAVAWTPPAGASMYKLEYRKTGSNGVFQSYGPDAIFDEAYMRLGDLEENTAYDLRVYAGNAAGWSAAAQLLGNPAVKDPRRVGVLASRRKGVQPRKRVARFSPRTQHGIAGVTHCRPRRLSSIDRDRWGALRRVGTQHPTLA